VHRTFLIPALVLSFALACSDAKGGSSSTRNSSTPDGEDGGGSASTSGGGSSGGDGVSAGFRAGVALVDITPTQAELDTKQLFLGGYGTPIVDQRAADGVLDPIEARAAALEAGGKAWLVAVLDVPGISNRVLRAIQAQTEKRTGVSRDAIWISATHSHAGPDFQGLWGGVPDGYKDRVIAATVEALSKAYESRESATLRVGSAEHDAKNRRDWDMTDRGLGVLSVETKKTGTLFALVNFAAHPTVLNADNTKVSGDYCAFVREHVSAKLKGAPVLFINGVMGDVSPIAEGSTAADAKMYGSSIGKAAVSALTHSDVVEPYLAVTREGWSQEVTNTTFVAALSAGLLDYEYEMQGLSYAVETQVSLARLGSNVQILAFPGEALTRTGLPIKEAMQAEHRMVFGLTGDTLGYFVPADEWETGRNDNYEEGVSLGKSAGDNAKKHALKLVEADNAELP